MQTEGLGQVGEWSSRIVAGGTMGADLELLGRPKEEVDPRDALRPVDVVVVAPAGDRRRQLFGQDFRHRAEDRWDLVSEVKGGKIPLAKGLTEVAGARDEVDRAEIVMVGQFGKQRRPAIALQDRVKGSANGLGDGRNLELQGPQVAEAPTTDHAPIEAAGPTLLAIEIRPAVSEEKTTGSVFRHGAQGHHQAVTVRSVDIDPRPDR